MSANDGHRPRELKIVSDREGATLSCLIFKE